MGDFVIGEIVKDMSWFGEIFGVVSFFGVVLFFGGNYFDNLGVYDVVGFVVGSYLDFGFGGVMGEFGEDYIGGFFVVLGFGEGDDDGEVDEFEGFGDEVVVVGDFFDGFVVEVVVDKGVVGDGCDDFVELGYLGDWFEVGGFGDVDKGFEVVVVYFFLVREVDFEGVMGEEIVEIFVEVNVGFVVEEDLVVGIEKFVSDIDDVGFDEGG